MSMSRFGQGFCGIIYNKEMIKEKYKPHEGMVRFPVREVKNVPPTSDFIKSFLPSLLYRKFYLEDKDGYTVSNIHNAWGRGGIPSARTGVNHVRCKGQFEWGWMSHPIIKGNFKRIDDYSAYRVDYINPTYSYDLGKDYNLIGIEFWNNPPSSIPTKDWPDSWDGKYNLDHIFEIPYIYKNNKFILASDHKGDDQEIYDERGSSNVCPLLYHYQSNSMLMFQAAVHTLEGATHLGDGSVPIDSKMQSIKNLENTIWAFTHYIEGCFRWHTIENCPAGFPTENIETIFAADFT